MLANPIYKISKSTTILNSVAAITFLFDIPGFLMFIYFVIIVLDIYYITDWTLNLNY